MSDTTRDPWDSMPSDGKGGIIIKEINMDAKRVGLPPDLQAELDEAKKRLEAMGVKPREKWW